MSHPSLQRPLTKNQTLVYDALEAADEPKSAYGLLKDLRKHGLRAPLQVYRALDTLLEAGLVHRLESLNAFVACRHPGCALHETSAFAICQMCGKVTEFAEKRVAALLDDWSRVHNFNLKRTTIELRGLCKACDACDAS